MRNAGRKLEFSTYNQTFSKQIVRAAARVILFHKITSPSGDNPLFSCGKSRNCFAISGGRPMAAPTVPYGTARQTEICTFPSSNESGGGQGCHDFHPTVSPGLVSGHSPPRRPVPGWPRGLPRRQTELFPFLPQHLPLPSAPQTAVGDMKKCFSPLLDREVTSLYTEDTLHYM